MHGEADVAVLADRRLAGVHAHPDPNDRSVGPLLSEQGALAGDRRLDRRAGAPEDREEGVALAVDLDPARILESRP